MQMFLAMRIDAYVGYSAILSGNAENADIHIRIMAIPIADIYSGKAKTWRKSIIGMLQYCRT